jgi:hypothetical protein
LSATALNPFAQESATDVVLGLTAGWAGKAERHGRGFLTRDILRDPAEFSGPV